MGRPSIDPELMIRMLVVGYAFAIRSERLICLEVQVNLACRWLCKLGIEDAVPDHSAFSRARNERFRDGDVLRRVFERIGTSGTVHEGKTLLYRARKLDCDVCPLKPQCCPKEPSRKIPPNPKIEMRFAHLKRILKLGRLRLRGPKGAQDEFVLAAIAQNLRRHPLPYGRQ
jgi:hypothetical protein